MILLDSKRISRTLKRMAYQVAEEARGAPIYMIGLNERGYSLARQMQPVIENVSGEDVPLKQFFVHQDSVPRLDPPPAPGSVLVLIDDVIFSGQTAQLAMEKIPERSQFEKIYISVLVDRGHRKYPVLASVVGINIPTKLNEHVELTLQNQQPDSVKLIKN